VSAGCPGCGNTTVHVIYSVPVVAVVQGATVTRVVVDDEAVGTPVRVECGVCERAHAAPGPPSFAAACTTAEAAGWPGWEFGW